MSNAANEITLRQLENHLKRNAKYKKTVILLGDSGCGKTQKINQFAKWYTPDAKTPLLTLVVSQRSTSDIQGMFVPTLERFDKAGQEVLVQKQTVPEFWLEMLFDPNCKMVLFLDEITNTPPSMQNILYTLLQDREICGRKIADGVVIIAAGNHMNNGGFTNNLAKPLLNRCAVYKIASNTKAAVDCWLEDFAYVNKIHPAVCSFVEEHPEMLNTNVVDKLPNQLFMSQRALGDKGGVSDVLWDWDNGAEFYESFSDVVTDLCALVGEHHAADIVKHYRYSEALPKANHLLDAKYESIHVSKETLGSLPLMQYTLSNIVSVWMSRFADESYSIEDLGKQLDNAISWLAENALCDLENNIIATATKFTRLVADNQTRYKGREGSRNKLVNFCEVFKQVTKIHTEMNAALKAA